MIPAGKLATFAVLAVVNLAMLLIVVAVVELSFGEWFRPYVPPAVAVMDRSHTYRQNLYVPHGDIRYVRDKYGLRGVHEPISAVDVVTVGGSTTDQRYIDEGQTWQDVMRQSCGLHIANAGADGMTSTGHVVAVDEWLHRIPDFRPKTFLHYIGVNDASVGVEPHESDLSGKHTPWLRDIRRRSIIAKGLEALLATFSPPREVAHGITVAPGMPSLRPVDAIPDSVVKYVQAGYASNLRKLLDLHRSRRETAILISQPSHPSIVAKQDGVTWVSTAHPGLQGWGVALHLINRATATVCGENPDVCRFSDAAADVAFGPGDFYDLVHLTPSGARKLGSYLCRTITATR